MKRETRIDGIRRLLRLPASRRSVAREVEDEIRFHLESRVRELVSHGLEAEAARAQAEREFGDLADAKRELTDVDRRRVARDRRALVLESLMQDLRYAVRGLRRQPAFTAVVVVTLTLGIGANAVVFGLVDRLLLQPPPEVAQPDGVARIYYRSRASGAFASPDGYNIGPITTYSVVTALREVPAFSEVAAYGRSAYTLGRGADASQVQVSYVSGNFFRLLGTRPELGRFFLDEEDQPPVGREVAVLSHGFWRSHFGGDPGTLGRTLLLNGTSFTVVGVAPRGFAGVEFDRVDLWVPVSAVGEAELGEGWHDTPNAWWARLIARLAPGTSRETAEAQATVAYRNEIRRWRDNWRDSLATVVAGPIIAARGPSGPSREANVSLWLMGVSVIVLLIACANIANLLLARATQRRREIAVRLAVGIGRGRLARQLLTEALLLTTLAAVVALLVAHWGGALVRAVLLPSIAFTESPVDVRVLAFTGVVTVLTAIFAGLVPALQATRTDVSSALKSGGREGGTRRARIRTTLLVAQAALSVVLLVGAGLFVRSLHRVRTLDVGIDLERVASVRMDLQGAGFANERVAEIFREARERALALPGVESATLAAASVPRASARAMGFDVPGRDSLPDLPGGGPYGAGVDESYFATLGARIIRGRPFTEADVRAGARVMIVNEAIAKGYWPDGDPVGECVTLYSDSVCTTIVGVAQNVLMFSMVGDERAQLYLPATHPHVVSFVPRGLLVRVTERAPIPVEVLRREIQALAPEMPFVSIRSFADLVAPELQPWRLGATMFGIFGVVALLIAAVGLYSVIAYLVSQRTHEIGVRMALGARRADVVGLVLGEGMRVAVVGLGLGVVAALVAGRYVADLLYETSPRDPAIIGTVAVTLTFVAIAAAILPSWRASRVDPVTALRSE